MCISDPTTQAPGCSVRTRSGSQSQVGHVSHALPRSKTLRVCHVLGVHSLRLAVCLLHFPGPSCSYSWVFYEGPVPVEPCISCFSQEEEAQTPPPRLVLCQGTVPGGFFAFYTSQAQAVQIPGCSMNAQSQLSHASPALPRPKWPGVLPEHSPRWGSLSNALPRSKLLRFQDVPEYTVPESHSGPQDSCDITVPGGPSLSCTAQVQSGHFLICSTRIQSMVSCASPQRSCSQVMKLSAAINCPKFQEAMISGCSWIEFALILAGDSVSWA